MNQADRTLNVSGILNSVAGESWVSVADKLARVSDADFETLLTAFRLYREAHGTQKETSEIASL